MIEQKRKKYNSRHRQIDNKREKKSTQNLSLKYNHPHTTTKKVARKSEHIQLNKYHSEYGFVRLSLGPPFVWSMIYALRTLCVCTK